MKELASLHDQHLNRPTLDDSSEQEHAIEITTQEITQVSVGRGTWAGYWWVPFPGSQCSSRGGGGLTRPWAYPESGP